MVEQLGLQTLRDVKHPESMIHSTILSRKKLSEKSTVEKPLPKFFHAPSVVNSFSKVDIKSPCYHESLLEMDSNIPYYVIPPKSSVTILVKINSTSVLETEFNVITKYSGCTTIPVNIGIDNRKKKRDKSNLGSGINSHSPSYVTS